VTSNFAKNSFSSNLNETWYDMLDVDETFTTIWLSRSSKVRVKVRRWPQSPIRTIFWKLIDCQKQSVSVNVHAYRHYLLLVRRSLSA